MSVRTAYTGLCEHVNFLCGGFNKVYLLLSYLMWSDLTCVVDVLYFKIRIRNTFGFIGQVCLYVQAFGVGLPWYSQYLQKSKACGLTWKLVHKWTWGHQARETNIYKTYFIMWITTQACSNIQTIIRDHSSVVARRIAQEFSYCTEFKYCTVQDNWASWGH